MFQTMKHKKLFQNISFQNKSNVYPEALTSTIRFSPKKIMVASFYLNENRIPRIAQVYFDAVRGLITFLRSSGQQISVIFTLGCGCIALPLLSPSFLHVCMNVLEVKSVYFNSFFPLARAVVARVFYFRLLPL